MRTLKNFVNWTLIVLLFGVVSSIAAEKTPQQFEEQRKAEAKAKREAADAAKIKKQEQEQLAQVKLPDDNTPRLKVKAILFTGNTLISTEQLLKGMPVVFNASDKSLAKAGSEYLYDFTPLRALASNPGETQEVSARTIQGFTQYVLSVYQHGHYGGIYVYVPADALKGGTELKDGILKIDVIEAHIFSVGTKYYDTNQAVVQKGRLDPNAVLAWSPVEPGAVMNQKKLNDYVNLLNLNPDRYVTATVSKGAESNTLDVNYGIYEANPWHYFIQTDNSGVRERQWNPREGIINTDLLGFDDSFFMMFQSPWDGTVEDNYSLFASYDFPIAGPGLRLNIYGGYSEFDLSPQGSNIDFIGAGKFIGADLKYNVLQVNDWFLDLTTSISKERSKITPSLFPEFLASNVVMNLWGMAVDIHKRDDLSNTSLGYKFTASIGGSDGEEFVKSRTGAESDFTINIFSAMYSRLLDPNKVNRISTSLRWITTEQRLTPAKMTPFGGMYSVRGYKEYEIIADGGFLASAQYEFDIIRYKKVQGESKEQMDNAEKQQSKKCGLKKLAPLAFADFGRTRINGPVGAEKGHQTLFSIGIGAIAEIGDNFSGGIYYGFPLKETEETDRGKGRVNVGLMMRW
jgi:hemolysin activation/secretion protein